MRIVDVNEYYCPTGGGVRTYIDRKMRLLADLGHELIVIAPGHENRLEHRPGGGRVFWVAAPRLPFDRSYGMFWDGAPVTALLDELNPDVVETSSPFRPAWIVANWRAPAAKVFFAHNDHMTAYAQRWVGRLASRQKVESWFGWYTRYLAHFLDRFDAFVTNGRTLDRWYSGRGLQVDAPLPLGVEGGVFATHLRDEQLRAALLGECHLPPCAHLLIGVGRHHPEKRWPMVIDAVEQAGQSAPIGLILLGDGVDRPKIFSRVAGNPHIRLFKPIFERERFASVLASADALVHGSDTEPFGLVALEAIASGLPLIVPNEGGSAEFAAPSHSESYNARDAKSCAAAILRLLARDSVQLRSATLDAAGRVRTDLDHLIDLLDYYNQLLLRRSIS